MTSRTEKSKDKGEKQKVNKHPSKASLSNGELFVQVVRGEDLLPMDFGVSSDPLITLKVSDGGKSTKKWSTKAVPKTLNPIWNEGTSFLIPTSKEDEAKVVATIYDEDQFTKNYMGEFSFTVPEVKNRENDFANMWFDVIFKKEKEKEQKSAGRVLCQIGYISAAQLEGPYQIVQRNADVLVNVLFLDDPWYSLIHALGKSYLSEKMASGIIQCAHQFDCVLPLVYSLIKREVQPSIQESTLFRTDSLSVKLLRNLFKQQSRSFARTTLAYIVQNVLDKPSDYDLEVDENGEGDKSSQSIEDQEQVRKKLFDQVVTFLEHLSSQLSTLPPLVCSILKIVRSIVTEVFPKSAKVSVGGFFFLRFLCPAMVSPETIDLIVESPNRQARRVLTLVSKLIQHMSNGTVFKECNTQMKDLNTFITTHTPKVQEILAKISEIDDVPKAEGQVNPYAEGIAKSLSREKLDNVSNHLTLFLHHLRDNSTKVKKDLQMDILATTSVVPAQRVQVNVDVVNLLSGDLELANQISRYVQTEKQQDSPSEIGLGADENVAFESQTVLFKGNGSWCGKIVITDQHRLLTVVKFFEYNKVEQIPLGGFTHDGLSQQANSFFYQPSDSKRSTTVTFQSSQEFQECLSALNAAIALSTPATDSSNRPSVMVSQTRDQCLRPYDWDQILTLASAKYYSPWSVICEGGKSISGLFQVVEGSVVVVKEGGGKEVMGSLLPMDVYGLVSFIDFAPAKLYLSAGEGGAMVAGLEATDLLKMFKQDHVLASKFYTYIALSLSKNLTMLTTRAAAVKKPKGQGGAKGGSKEKGAGKGDEGEDKEESVVVSAVLCRRRDAHGHFTVYNTHAAFLSKVFGSKVEVMIDYVALRAKSVTLSVIVLKGKKRLQMKGEEGQTYIFKLDDPQSLIDLIQAQAAKGLKAQASGRWSRAGSVCDLEEKHETMSATDWDFLLTDGSKIMKFKKDEPCLVEGDIQNNLYQITSGSVRIEKGGNVVAKLGQGSIFGELAFLQWYSDGTEAKASANVIADARKVEMVMLDGKFVSGALAKNARLRSCFFVYISQLIVDRLRKTLEMTYGDLDR